MTDNIIKVLNPNSYRSFKGWITETGNMNPVFVASFKHPSESKPIDMYAKIYSFKAGNRSVFNELIGYLMANALELPQPKYACIAFIPTSQLIKNIPNGALNESLNAEVFQNNIYPIFCTSKIDPSQTAYQYYNCVEAVAQELAKWPDMGKAVAMDNTICHTDRHVNNVLRTGVNKYYLIDNGILIDTDGWKIKDLEPNTHFKNKLLYLSEHLMTENQFTKVKGEAILACDNHTHALTQIISEIKYWINALYSQYRNDYESFVDFLDNRTNNAHGLLTSRLQILI